RGLPSTTTRAPEGVDVTLTVPDGFRTTAGGGSARRSTAAGVSDDDRKSDSDFSPYDATATARMPTARAAPATRGHGGVSAARALVACGGRARGAFSALAARMAAAAGAASQLWPRVPTPTVVRFRATSMRRSAPVGEAARLAAGELAPGAPAAVAATQSRLQAAARGVAASAAVGRGTRIRPARPQTVVPAPRTAGSSLSRAAHAPSWRGLRPRR